MQSTFSEGNNANSTNAIGHLGMVEVNTIINSEPG